MVKKLREINILAVMGVSGSGKTELVNSLSNHDQSQNKDMFSPLRGRRSPKKFVNLEQVTTRSRRSNESVNSYKFLTETEYDILVGDNKLTAKTQVGDYRYGTILDTNALAEKYDIDNTIFTIVVNAKGYYSLKSHVDTNGFQLNMRGLRVVPHGNKPYVQRKGRNYKEISEESIELNTIEDSDGSSIHRIHNAKKTNGFKLFFLKAFTRRNISSFGGNDELYRFKDSFDVIREMGDVDNDWEEYVSLKSSQT